MTNLTKFLEAYKAALRTAREEFPDVYSWPLEEFDTVYGRMAQAILKGSFNKDSVSFKRTCKALGIPHTYKAIQEFLDRKENTNVTK